MLWAAVLLTMLTAGLTGSGRADVRLATNLRGAADAEAAADGAVHLAAFHLLDSAEPWLADGQARALTLGRVRLAIRIEDEAGKVNPNLANPGLLQALMQQVGADPATATRVAAAIAEWRFPGNASQMGGGTKAELYRRAGLAYAPWNAPFRSLQQVGAVLGMSPELLTRLGPYVSVLTDAQTDAAVAPPPVLAALGLLAGAPTQRLPPRTVTVTAEALTAGGSRFTRRATIRLAATPNEPLMQVLTWTAE